MSGPSRNTQTIVAGIKLTIFVVVSLIVTGTLTAIMGSFSFSGETEYKAAFSTASLIKKGDDVRVAGVSVGNVKKVEIKDRDQAEITFKVRKDVALTTATRASIRYLNLVGDRYMALEQGAPGGRRLAKDGTIPLAHTTPALNLTELFNGFQPLFQALQPAEVNQLSLNLVKVLQGEGGTVNSLLGNTASLTNALADRDQLIGQVIDNLSALLKTTDDHHTQLSSLIVQLKDWMTNLSADRKTIGASITNLSGLTAEVAKLLTQGRPYIKADVAQVARTMAIRGDQPAADDAAAPGAGRELRQLVPVLPLRHRRQDHHAEVQQPRDRRAAGEGRGPAEREPHPLQHREAV
jgi:phospholipid/cholesterol/gamma-HCH transport system substrate-binding protein